MTTIRRPHKRRQQHGMSRCAMLGLVIVSLIVLHLFGVAFLYQKVPATPDSRVGGLRHYENFNSVLKQSKDSLKARAGVPQVPKKREFKPQKERKRHGVREKPAAAVDTHDSEANKDNSPNEVKEVERARERPQGADSTDIKDEESPELKEEKKDEKQSDENEEIKANDVVFIEKTDKENQHESPEVEERGNRVTDRAYIGDFDYEREHPAFRMQELKFPGLDARVESLESCAYVSGHRLLTHAACREDDTLLTAFNSQPFSRFWCEKEIEPDSVERFDEPCHEPVRLFPMKDNDFPVSGENMKPIVITATKESDNLEEVSCDIPCQQEVGMEGLTWYIQGTDWKITTTPEDPASVREAKIDGNAFRNDHYYSTVSFQSSVPLTPFSFDDYDLTVEAVSFDDTLPSASYLIDSACSSQASKRHRWVGAVERHFPVAFYGSCSHNTDLPDGMSLSNRKDRVQLHRKHRFNLAFESSNEKDYMTEVIFDAFQSGSLPVILGPANIEDHFPPNSFINAGSYQSWDDFGKYIKQVSENKTLWESYHAWRKDPDALNAFQKRFNFTRTDATCRMCRWAYAKQYGLGWDHEQQIVKTPALSRELCVDSELVTKPFVESYLTRSGDTYEEVAAGIHDSSNCQTGSTSVRAEFDWNEFHIERTVEAHYGVIDLVINHISRPAAGGDFILQLEFGVKNDGGASFRNPHILVETVHGPLCTSVAIQDEQSKVTVLANFETEFITTKEGTIGIVVSGGSEGSLQEDEIRRVRVVVEDRDVIHDKVSEYYPSSYGKKVIHDFIDPLEFFYNTN